MQEREYGIAILGIGTVGGAVAQEIVENAKLVAHKTGIKIVLKRIIEVRDERFHELNLDISLKSTLEEAIEDPEVQLLVELAGGLGFAATAIEKTLMAGKPVVTANKALLAARGPQLFALARKHGAWISFEASCEGAVPIVRALSDGVIANNIEALYGITNGTCNYILSAMTSEGRSYADVLQEAQADGLAEADPSLDVQGYDTAHKLAILSSLAFAQQVDDASFPVKGIDSLDIRDINYGKELGYTIKLLAVAVRHCEGLSLSVAPHFISDSHPLAWVSGAFNAVSVYGHAAGHSMYYGRGAGGKPTASAVIADIISSALGTAELLFKQLNIWPDLTPKAKVLPSGLQESRWYLRLEVRDRPGVLAKVSGILGEFDISISSALQKETAEKNAKSDTVPFIITTHRSKAGNIEQAIEKISALADCPGGVISIPILDEHQEFSQ